MEMARGGEKSALRARNVGRGGWHVGSAACAVAAKPVL
jgi:hypothetical protein